MGQKNRLLLHALEEERKGGTWCTVMDCMTAAVVLSRHVKESRAAANVWEMLLLLLNFREHVLLLQSWKRVGRIRTGRDGPGDWLGLGRVRIQGERGERGDKSVLGLAPFA